MSGKSPKFEIEVNGEPRFSGRLIGFITRDECRAVMNIEDAPRKVSTAEGIDEKGMAAALVSGKRFVIVTDDYKKGKRQIFISPVIRFATFSKGIRSFCCMDQNEYGFRKKP